MDTPQHDIADPFTEAGFRALARNRLDAAPSPAIFDPRSGKAFGPSDWDLNPELKGDLAVMAPPRPAAVLVPIVLRAALTVLLTQRSHDMPSHPGQISFPGGKVEETDAGPLACALREAEEEIGLPRESVEVLAELPQLTTRTSGIGIAPFLARIQPPPRWRPDPREIAAVIEPRLDELARPEAHGETLQRFAGHPEPQRISFVRVGGERLWGASYRILKPLLPRILAGEWPL